MHPDLLTFGPFTLHTYGLFTALGFLSAFWLARAQARREGIPLEAFTDLAFWILFAGLLGARLLYVITTWKEYAARPLDALKIWDGGLVFYGGFILAAVALWVFVRRHRLNLRRIADVVAPYIPLGHAFGRIGCFFSGCCYGRVDRDWGVVFPALGDGLPHLPTQVYEAVFNAGLFVFLVLYRRRRRFEGQLFWLYIALYAAWRFGVEFLRGDEIRGTVLVSWLHTSQLIALAALALAGVMLGVLGRRPKAS